MMALNPVIESWVGQRVWVVGASYGIGAELARQLINAGSRVALSARSRSTLDAIAVDTETIVEALDVTNAAAVAAAAGRLIGRWGAIDLTLIVAGTHIEMRAANFDLVKARRLVEVNVMGPMNVIAAILPGLLEQGRGSVAIVASIAGYRGLPRALVYGPTKAAMINFAESLYGDLHAHGIGVYLVNPGFVDTPLTRKNNFNMPALMPVTAAAHATLEGIARGQFEIHYPRRFTHWMKLLRGLPYGAYFAAVRRFTGA
jgi:short-subunit dehydrogenase